DALAGDRHRRHGRGLNAVGSTERVQAFDISFTVVAEVEIVAHGDVARIESLQQQLVQKCIGAQFGELPIEARADEQIDAESARILDFFAQRRQACRRLLGAEEFQRHGFESHQGTGNLQSGRMRVELLDDGLMAAVQTVEIADGERTARQLLQALHVAYDSHVRLPDPRPVYGNAGAGCRTDPARWNKPAPPPLPRTAARGSAPARRIRASWPDPARRLPAAHS